MHNSIRYEGLIAWTVFGMTLGFVVYTVLSMIPLSPVITAIASGAAGSFFSVLMYIEHESNNNKFLAGLSAISIAFIGSVAKHFLADNTFRFSIGYLLMGIIVGILISVSVVAYILKE